MRSTIHNKGFTLIELLVVISIIALLSSIVLASITTAREKARVTVMMQEIKQFQSGMELYRASNPQYYASPWQTTVPNYDPYVRSAENAPYTAFKTAVSKYITLDSLKILTTTSNTFHYIDGPNSKFYAGFGAYDYCGGVAVSLNGYFVSFQSSLNLPLGKWGGDPSYYCFTNI